MAEDENVKVGDGAGAPASATHPTASAPTTSASTTPATPPSAVPSPAVPPSALPSPVVLATAPGTAAEWTASDARGPLNAAGERTDPQVAGFEANDANHPVGGSTDAEHLSFDAPAIPEHPALADDAVFADASRASGPSAASPGAPGAVAARRSPWPVAAGIVLGALIGAGSAAAYYAYAATQGGDASQIAALSSRLDALQNRPDAMGELAAVKASVADLGAKVAALQKSANAPSAPDQTAGPAFDPAPLERKLAALQGEVDAAKQQGTDTKALDDKVAALASGVAALQGGDGKIAALQASLDDLRKQSVANQSGLETLRSNQKTLEGKVTSSPALAVVADSLVAQIGRGEPYASQVEALSALGADPATVAVLKENADKGVPSAKVLAAKFEPLADPIVASAQPAAPNAGFWDRLKSGMSGLVSIRGANDTTGDTLGAHVALIEADLAHDDVAGAYTVWGALPAAAKAKSEAWGALAKTHAEAMRAARALQAQAITALGAKKS